MSELHEPMNFKKYMRIVIFILILFVIGHCISRGKKQAEGASAWSVAAIFNRVFDENSNVLTLRFVE